MQELKPGDVFWDIGAHWGVYSVLAFQRGANVIAFEAYPFNAEKLAQNARLNRCDARIEIMEMALSDRSGTAGFDIKGGRQGFMLGSIVDERQGTLVKTVTGDELVDRGVLAPDVVKIDVEGLELNVLRGMYKALKAKSRAVFCEIHMLHAAEQGLVGKVEELLCECGFEVQIIHKRLSEHFVKAIKQKQ